MSSLPLAQVSAQSAPVRRTAFFGGTFDPPHRGHLAVAQAAAERFALGRVLLAPVGRQPLKTEPARASFADRLAMTALLAREDARLKASALDRPRENGAPNYTVDALRQLSSEVAGSGELYAIAGADAFLTLRQWRASDELLALARWIVVSRPGFALSDLDRLELSAVQRERVFLLDDVRVPISATALRARLASGESCAHELSPAVAAYISAHKLYGERA